MILTAHQPVYLPWLGFIHKLSLCDTFVFMDDVDFSRNSMYARNRIRDFMLTVPTEHQATSGLIKDAKIVDNGWRKKHWTQIYQSYSKTPYFRRYAEFFEHLYQRPWERLVDLNYHILKQILIWFELDIDVKIASEHNFVGSKSTRLIAYCNRFGADTYVFGLNGKGYADLEAFESADIDVCFQDYRHPTYGQGRSFEPNLSFIDLLFNCGPDKEIVCNMQVNKTTLIKGSTF